jgi:hypothetical protein
MSRARLAVVTLLLLGTVLGGMSWITGHAGASHARVLAGGTWCC